MQNHRQVTLAITEDTMEKLVELAGGESHISEYLTHLVAMFHAQKSGQAGQVELEQAIIEIHELLENEKKYKQQIHGLEQRLSLALASQSVFVEATPYESRRRVLRAKTLFH